MAETHAERKKRLLKILLLAYPVIADGPSTRHDLHNTSIVIHTALLETEKIDDPSFAWGDHIAIWLTLNPLAPRAGSTERPRPVQGGHRITEAYLRSLPAKTCKWKFRFTADELIELAEALDVVEPIITETRHKFDPLEAVALLCARYRSSGDLYDLVEKYDRSASALSELIIDLVKYLDERWKHLLDFDHDFVLSPPQLAEYAEAIRKRGSPIWTLFGFVDCTIRRIARPTWFQMAAYNGHKKIHALKYQAVMLPNGLIGHLYGPVEGRHHDVWMLEESRFLEKCEEHALVPGTDENSPAEERFYQIFGDSAYGVGPHIQSNFHGSGQRTEDELEFNAKMGKLRIVVEHGFGLVATKWPWLNAGWKMHLFASPVGLYYRIGVLLCNAHNCVNPNQVAQYFELLPPDLSEYFHD